MSNFDMARRVTSHAILRWLERVESLDVDALRREVRAAGRDATRPGDVLEYLATERGVSIDHIRQAILTPEVIQALAQPGVHQVDIGCAVVIIRRGMVTTILTPSMHQRDMERAA